MFMFTLLSTFFVLSYVRTVGYDWDSSRLSTSTIITKNIHGHALYIEHGINGGFMQPPRRRLLEHPRWIKQTYRNNDIVQKRHRARNKLDESRSYRSAVEDDEDEDEDDEEEEEAEEEDKTDNEDADEETEEQAEDEEETVARSGSRNRVARSGYVPFEDKVGERERQEVVRIRSATEECEDESTEPSQYYEYETEVRNVASQDGDRKVFLAKLLGANILILLFT